jgi:nucleotide-binding universal stress UspA family protein
MTVNTVPAGTIVVGVDGSPASDQAVSWAADQAALEHRQLTLVHSVGHNAWIDLPEYGAAITVARTEGQTLVDRSTAIVKRRAPSVAVQQVVRLGDPRVVLLELSADASMIVLGSRGRGPVRSMMLGSVGLTVTEQASCPVVVLRPQHVGTVRRGVLVGVDGTERSRAAIEFAYRQASIRSQPLTVMSCFFDTLSWAVGTVGPADDDESVAGYRLALTESVAGMSEKFPDVNVTLTLHRGQARDALVHATKTMDLVVVGTHPHGHLAGLVQSDVGRGVVEHGHGVVAVVPDPK